MNTKLSRERLMTQSFKPKISGDLTSRSVAVFWWFWVDPSQYGLDITAWHELTQ